MKRRPVSQVQPKKGFRLKSSPEARKLIEIAVKHGKGSEHKAARLLRLPNQAQLNKMRRGLIRDTPAMKAALQRANQRARRAWAFIPPHIEQCDAVDKAIVATLWRELKALTKRFESLMPKEDSTQTNQPAP